MNPRATGILLLLAAALGAFVWLYEIEGEEGRKEAADAEKRLFVGLDPEDVTWVELVTGEGTRVRAERDAAGWQIRQPLDFPGDAGAWDGIAAALTASTREAVFDEPQAPEVYGLGDGADEVRFATEGAEHTLRLGDPAPLDADMERRAADLDQEIDVQKPAHPHQMRVAVYQFSQFLDHAARPTKPTSRYRR